MAIMSAKVCIITGGAGSVGLESAKVMLVDNNQEMLTQALAAIRPAASLWRTAA